jgi:hypothetical protein
MGLAMQSEIPTMDRYQITIITGGAIPGRIGGEMIMSNHSVVQYMHPS